MRFLNENFIKYFCDSLVYLSFMYVDYFNLFPFVRLNYNILVPNLNYNVHVNNLGIL